MNIFILDKDPVIAAQYHCDAHLHKMVLEAAQMLSTAAHKHFPRLKGHIYAPAYEKHPCTLWVSASFSNMDWLCSLATSLNQIREIGGSNRHASMDVIDAIWQNCPEYPLDPPTEFAEAMYLHIKCRTELSTVEKYQLYYRKKNEQWIKETGKGMTWKNRKVPEFMKV